MNGSITIEIWHVAVGSLGVVFSVAVLFISILRWQFGTLAKGQMQLFNFANESRDRIQQLEKFALVVDMKTALRFIAERKE